MLATPSTTFSTATARQRRKKLWRWFDEGTAETDIRILKFWREPEGRTLLYSGFVTGLDVSVETWRNYDRDAFYAQVHYKMRLHYLVETDEVDAQGARLRAGHGASSGSVHYIEGPTLRQIGLEALVVAAQWKMQGKKPTKSLRYYPKID